MLAVIGRAAAGLALLAVTGCAATGGESGKMSLAPPSWLGGKSEHTTQISGLKPGPYEASSLAVGEEKDIAQRRGDGLGFVRSAPIELYLNELRSKIVGASGKTGVPGRVMILANPAFAAYSTPDGNVYVSMGVLESLETEDEVAALLAHETSHVLLKHHSSDLMGDMQKKAQALYEIGVGAKTAVSGSKTVSKSDARGLNQAQLAVDATDKLVLPAWNRPQEREADLLGVDLLVESRHSAPAMITMLEKLQAWEKANSESEESFGERVKQAAQRNVNEAVSMTYQRMVETVSASHPKTSERIEETAQYLERHYGSRDLGAPKGAPWTALKSRPDVAQVMRNYKQAFSAKKLLDQGKAQEAYAAAKAAATERTATDAYPNWVLARSAAALGRQREAIDALRRAVSSTEPVPQVYEDLIIANEQVGSVPVALEWTDRASATFGGAPRWTPHKIRLLRKTGRIAEAETLTLNCAVSTPDWKRPCQEANQTPAGRAPQR